MSKAKPAGRRKTRTAAQVPAEFYAPTDKERSALALLLNRLDEGPGHARATIEVREGTTKVGWDHPSQPVGAVLWANALGTADLVFAATLMDQIAQFARTGAKLEEKELNGMLSIVRGLAPTDSTEALLVTQMAAIHTAMITAARRLVHVESLAQQDSHSNMLNKLARTFVAQIEGLKRYRTGGEQTIKMQHVTVNDGGQAIVGDVQHTGGPLKNESQSHEQLASHALGPPLLGSIQANGDALPGPGRAGTERVPISRCAGRSAEGKGQRPLPPRRLHD